MKNHHGLLTQHIAEQIALEEHLCTVIQQQISEVDETEFPDAREVLIGARQVLERHLVPLNEMLDHVEENAAAQKKPVAGNGVDFRNLVGQNNRKRLSRILRDDFGALNLITMSNTLLHTTALALDSREVAATALLHLQELTPIVVSISEMMPGVIAQELESESHKVDPTVAQIALKNTQLAWRRKS